MSGLPPPNVLTYEGQVAVPFIVRTFDPTTSNYQFNVPTIWVNSAAEKGFILLGKPMNVAAWAPFSGGSVVTETLTGNSGGAVPPTGNNINVVGGGSITTVGNPGTSTLTVEFTGLTNHAVQVGAGTTTLTQVGPSTTSGQVFQSGGFSADPAFSTATYPATTTVNQILYSSATNVVSGLATVNDASLTTNASGTPTWLTMTDGQVIIGSSSGAPAAATLTAGTGVTITNGHNSITISTTGYTQGTFTPGIAFGGNSVGVTYVDQIGEFTHIGDIVYFKLILTLSSKGSSTGAAAITGFPVSTTAVEQDIGIPVTRSITYDANYTNAFLNTSGTSGTNFFVNEFGASVGYQGMADTNFTNTSQIKMTGFYFTS